jgi:hypothetical protein
LREAMIFPVGAYRLAAKFALMLDERHELERIDVSRLGGGFNRSSLFRAVDLRVKEPYREQRCSEPHRRKVCSWRFSS